MGIDVFMEMTMYRLLTEDGRVSGAIGYDRSTGALHAFNAKAVILATGGVGKAWKVTSNSWEYTGDGFGMALEAGADLIDMEMTQFHPTGMMWPLSVRGLLVTEGVRGDGGTLKNKDGKRSCSTTSLRSSRRDRDNGPRRRWYEDKRTTVARRTSCRGRGRARDHTK